MTFRNALIVLLLASPLAAAEALKPRKSSDGIVYQVHYDGSQVEGELSLPVDFYLWVPDDAKQLRGIIVHQHGCGPGASLGGRTAADDLHWQALARKWNCALLGSSYAPRKGAKCRLWCDSRNGSADRFLQALDHFAATSKRSEVATVPWCLWGHSGGGFWASLMQVTYPERIVAIWYQSGTAYSRWTSGEIPKPKIPAATFGVPAIGNPGLKEKTHERFHKAWDGLVAMQKAYRQQGAFFEFASDPRTGHECGDSRYLSIPFFDFWLEHRLPSDGIGKLRPVNSQARAAWQKQLAAKLADFIKTGSVPDATPPPAPTQVRTTLNQAGQTVVTWQAKADFESGIGGFVIERNGKSIGQLPEKPNSRFGRPLFQGMSYHDTPEAPLAEMKFIDMSAGTGVKAQYTVRTVNSVGLKSDAAVSVR